MSIANKSNFVQF